jgi:hypothetical protein
MPSSARQPNDGGVGTGWPRSTPSTVGRLSGGTPASDDGVGRPSAAPQRPPRFHRRGNRRPKRHRTATWARLRTGGRQGAGLRLQQLGPIGGHDVAERFRRQRLSFSARRAITRVRSGLSDGLTGTPATGGELHLRGRQPSASPNGATHNHQSSQPTGRKKIGTAEFASRSSAGGAEEGRLSFSRRCR